MHPINRLSLLLSVIAMLGLFGCSGAPRPVAFGTPDSFSLSGPAVETETSDALYRLVPRCIAVRATGFGGADHGIADILEKSIVRHARDRFDRVIGGAARRGLERSLVVDLAQERDRRVFSRNTGCSYFLDISPWKSEDGYFLVWSRRSIGASIRLSGVDPEKTLWRARHTTLRQDGGLPLSPLGFLFDVARAGAFQADPDIPRSLADELARRLFVSLPDMRSLAQR
ncbi:MAG: hypothetical protein O3A96_12010 [Proteobacteria bacterium]|nr:hypothetical protein [Pseudomonadota bacterium]